MQHFLPTIDIFRICCRGMKTAPKNNGFHSPPRFRAIFSCALKQIREVSMVHANLFNPYHHSVQKFEAKKLPLSIFQSCYLKKKESNY